MVEQKGMVVVVIYQRDLSEKKGGGRAVEGGGGAKKGGGGAGMAGGTSGPGGGG